MADTLHDSRSNGADSLGVVAELRRVAALFQLRAICAALEIPAPVARIDDRNNFHGEAE